MQVQTLQSSKTSVHVCFFCFFKCSPEHVSPELTKYPQELTSPPPLHSPRPHQNPSKSSSPPELTNFPKAYQDPQVSSLSIVNQIPSRSQKTFKSFPSTLTVTKSFQSSPSPSQTHQALTKFTMSLPKLTN